MAELTIDLKLHKHGCTARRLIIQDWIPALLGTHIMSQGASESGVYTYSRLNFTSLHILSKEYNQPHSRSSNTTAAWSFFSFRELIVLQVPDKNVPQRVAAGSDQPCWVVGRADRYQRKSTSQ